MPKLAKLGFSNLADFYRVGKDGRLEVDTDALADPVKAAALSQIEITTTVAGDQVIKVKLADKRVALNDLGRYLGLFNDRGESTVTVIQDRDHDQPSDQELALAVLALLNEARYERRKQLEQTARRLEGPSPIAEPVGDDDFDLDE